MKAALLAVLLTTAALGQTRPSATDAPRAPRQAGAVIAPPQGRSGQSAGANGGVVDTTPSDPGVGEEQAATGRASLLKGEAYLFKASDMAPDTYLKEPKNRTLVKSDLPGVQTAAGDVVSELVLILGEIVVDRATNRAFDLLKDKLQLGLACTDATTSKFRRTCEVVAPLRLQELAVTTSALQGAVLHDIMVMGLERTKPTSEKTTLSKEDYFFLARLIQSGLLPHLTRPHRPLSSEEANALVQDILSFSIEKAKTQEPCSQPRADEKHAAAAVLVTAGAALAACLEASLTPGVDPSSCSVMQVADEFANNCPYLRDNKEKKLQYTHHARVIARHLHVAATARVDGKSNGVPDVRVRMGHAIDAVFEMTCRLAGREAGCDSAPDADDDARVIGILRSASHAALDRDTNAMIGAASMAIGLVKADAAPAARRGLRIIGGVLQYAETYYQPRTIQQEGSGRVEAATDTRVVEEAHASRRKILESLTEEMTNRTGRDTDVIFSVGGSLRATGGVRFPSGAGRDAQFEGPLSLPLGLGVQIPCGSGKPGIHLEAGVVDIGRYVSIRDRSVNRFDAADALAPSLSAGLYWGHQFPFFLALSGIYQPLFVSPAVPEQEGRPAVPESVGAWSLAFNVGVYVPLFDLN